MTLYTYALIDGILRQTAIQELYSRNEPLQTIPLYINTPYKDNYDLGPILVAALDDSTLINEIQQSWTNSTTIIQSSKYLQVVADHLKQIIMVTDSTGSNSLFRFADPLVTWYWLNSYEQNTLTDIMGPIAQWQVAKPVTHWNEQKIDWQIFLNPNTPPLGLTINHLNQPQVDALEEAQKFRFKNRLFDWLKNSKSDFFQGKTPEQIELWMDYNFKEAQAFNLISELSYAIWMELSLDHGVDFASQPKGLYQQWLIDNPKIKGLPNEVKIQNFYDDLINLEQMDNSLTI